ncbi:MAG TPA: hypothetical protein VK084_05395 [Chitinophagaceae bacterium]|nr:hypothetical protein [Chitinophagaceae bacterium]
MPFFRILVQGIDPVVPEISDVIKFGQITFDEGQFSVRKENPENPPEAP